MAVLVFLIACALPALAFLLLSRGFDWLVRFEPRRRAAPPPDPALADLGCDLRRLTHEHDWLLRTDVPGKALRLRAVQLAYDDTLLRAARQLQIELPDPPLPATTRLQAEAELATHGFTW